MANTRKAKLVSIAASALMVLAIVGVLSFCTGCGRIDILDPLEGYVGETVTINGDEFGDTQGANARVTFSGVEAPVSSWSKTQIVVTVPEGASSGPVQVWHGPFPSNQKDFTVLKGRARWTPDGEAACNASDKQYRPQIISNGSGEAIICWDDGRLTANYDIYAQKLSTDGAVQWTADGKPVCLNSNTQWHSKITSDLDGNAIITWMGNPGTNIWAQKMNQDGDIDPGWPSEGVRICHNNYSQYNPEIASDLYGGGAIIVWEDLREGVDLYAQRIDSNGAIQWGTGGLPVCTASGTQIDPQIVSVEDEFGGAIITWHETSAVYAQKIDSKGVAQWAPGGKVICSGPGTRGHVRLVSDGSGGAVITWVDTRLGSPDIYVQRIDSTGDDLWNLNGVAICRAPGASSPEITSDGSGGAIVSWEDERWGEVDIFTQRIDSDGIPQWTDDGRGVCNASGEQTDVRITSDGFGGAIYCWKDQRSGEFDIYSQRIDSTGKHQWPTDGIPVCVAEGEQKDLQIVPDYSGGAIVTWCDHRSGIARTYAQRITD